MDWTDYDTRVAAYAIVTDGPRVLLALWNEVDPPLWSLPGGGVEFGETLDEGAIREVREETGYDVELTALIGADNFHVSAEDRRADSNRALRGVRIVFAARIIGGHLTHEENGSTGEARWFDIAEVETLLRVPLVDVGLSFARRAAVLPPA